MQAAQDSKAPYANPLVKGPQRANVRLWAIRAGYTKS